MSPPRPVFENDSLIISRRTTQLEFRLRPDSAATEIITYILAILTAKYQIELHAVCVMSNYWHAVIFDPNGRVSDFTRDFHSFTARHLNRHYQDREALWNSSQTSHVRPESPTDLLRGIDYTMSNPVKAGLVLYGHRWTGLRGAFGDDPITVTRPKGFFRTEEKKSFPAQATLRFHKPRCLEGTDQEVAKQIADNIEAAETAARREVFEEGRSFMGIRAVKKQPRHRRPSTRTPRPDRRRRRHTSDSPRVACIARWPRIERTRANRQWLAEYVSCRKRFRDGERDVLFPHGTYKMRIVDGVHVRAERFGQQSSPRQWPALPSFC